MDNSKLFDFLFYRSIVQMNPILKAPFFARLYKSPLILGSPGKSRVVQDGDPLTRKRKTQGKNLVASRLKIRSAHHGLGRVIAVTP
ncbi:Hypothetical protein Minf_0916 [Methylacidiphilum infernorum V4]|uniref:Uncharacterized protein n=1 Tax=Methylacidiphilum infernorum (isolate V4) TaxID=481448 RepID=B3DUG8_METI4|nr:Hypothetical protein Minf_0916 [Methylacidiphilum infernorum V4]